jgi:2-polyprenyl-3-methyl-5-hydroxy-6-metoxy-1,4-benzoquinol methylase
MTAALPTRQIARKAAAMYRPSGRFAYHFANGKLSTDPVFTGIFLRKLIPDRAHILDLGCGQGLLAAWLLAAQEYRQSMAWDSGWPEPPRAWTYHGIELMPRDVERAHRALGPRVRIELGDIRTANLSAANIVIILDVLHYVDLASQEVILERVKAALSPDGTLILRIGDAGAGMPFSISNWVDRTMLLMRGHGLVQLNGRRVEDWVVVLKRLGFEVTAIPMSEKTPFANVLLVARVA